MRRLRRIGTRAIAGLVLGSAAAGTAQLPAVADVRILGHQQIISYNAGASSEAWAGTTPNGGVRVWGWLRDNAPDGLCAHVQISWVHINNQTYTDYRYFCGYPRSTAFEVPARNPKYYRYVVMGVFVDGETPRTSYLAYV